MAKKQKQKQEIEIEEPTVIEEEEDNPVIKIKDIDTPKEIDNDDIPDELQSVIDECGADCSYTVGVFRYNDKTQQKEKVGTYQIAEFKPDMIAKTYGGGKYEYMIRVGNKLHRRLTTTYATAVVPDKPQVPTLQEIQNMINNNKNENNNDSNVMMKMLELQQQQMTTILTTMLQQNQNNQQKSSDDSFDKAIKLMTALGVRNANSDIDKMLSVFQKGLDLSTKVSDLQGNDDEDDDTGLVSKLLKGVLPKLLDSNAGQEILQKLLAGKNANMEIPKMEQQIPETIIQPQTMQQPLQSTSIDIVKAFLNKHKKKILIQFNSNTTAEDLAEFYYNGIVIDDELVNAFTEVFLGDIKPIIADIPEFNETNIMTYVTAFLDKMKELLYNSDTEDEETQDTEENNVSTQKTTDTK